MICLNILCVQCLWENVFLNHIERCWCVFHVYKRKELWFYKVLWWIEVFYWGVKNQSIIINNDLCTIHDITITEILHSVCFIFRERSEWSSWNMSCWRPGPQRIKKRRSRWWVGLNSFLLVALNFLFLWLTQSLKYSKRKILCIVKGDIYVPVCMFWTLCQSVNCDLNSYPL